MRPPKTAGRELYRRAWTLASGLDVITAEDSNIQKDINQEEETVRQVSAAGPAF